MKSNSKGNFLMSMIMPARRAEEDMEDSKEEDDNSTSSHSSITGEFEVLDPSSCILSWKSYRKFWSTHYPNLKVSRPVEDICSYCYKVHNRFRYKQRSPIITQEDFFTASSTNNEDVSASFVCMPATNSEDQHSTSAEEDEDNHDRISKNKEDNNDGVVNINHAHASNTEEIDEATFASEEEIIKAGEHVKMARAQRALVNEKRMDQANKAD